MRIVTISQWCKDEVARAKAECDGLKAPYYKSNVTKYSVPTKSEHYQRRMADKWSQTLLDTINFGDKKTLGSSVSFQNFIFKN